MIIAVLMFVINIIEVITSSNNVTTRSHAKPRKFAINTIHCGRNKILCNHVITDISCSPRTMYDSYKTNPIHKQIANATTLGDLHSSHGECCLSEVVDGFVIQ